MHFLPLLGRQIKADEVIDILECFEMDVIYDFDRSHEGMPDTYWATSEKGGFRLRFDAAQVLDVIFLRVVPEENCTEFSQNDCDIPFFASASSVQSFGEAQRLQVATGRADFLGVSRDWVRLGFTTHSLHYEFRGGRLALVTISRSDGSAS